MSRFQAGSLNPKWNSGLTLRPNGYLRITAGRFRDWYAHRAYADRQMRFSLGRGIRREEEVHHTCKNRSCWPPSDFHLLICDEAIHHAIEAWNKRVVKRGKRK